MANTHIEAENITFQVRPEEGCVDLIFGGIQLKVASGSIGDLSRLMQQLVSELEGSEFGV